MGEYELNESNRVRDTEQGIEYEARGQEQSSHTPFDLFEPGRKLGITPQEGATADRVEALLDETGENQNGTTGTIGYMPGPVLVEVEEDEVDYEDE